MRNGIGERISRCVGQYIDQEAKGATPRLAAQTVKLVGQKLATLIVAPCLNETPQRVAQDQKGALCGHDRQACFDPPAHSSHCYAQCRGSLSNGVGASGADGTGGRSLSDLFDVLAHIAYATEPMTRQECAEVGAQAIKGNYDEKLVSFLTFVLGQYVEAGTDGLDRPNLPVFFKLKYVNPLDGAKALGGADHVAGSYEGFQKHLYSQA
jgi:hypothetical protein